MIDPKQDIASAYIKNKPAEAPQQSAPTGDEKPPQQADVTTDVKESKKNVDIVNKNDYIPEGEGGKPDADMDKYKKLLEDTFQNDPIKLAKSYTNSQREYANTQTSLNKLQQALQDYETVLEKNPLLRKAVEEATQGKSIDESYFQKSEKPTGKSTPTYDSKLANDFTTVGESQLVEAGYLDLKLKDQLPANEWALKVMESRMQYMADELPKSTLQKTLAQIEEQNAKIREQQQTDEVIKTNRQRLDTSIEEAVRAGYDFTGEHKELLNDAIQQARYMLDPTNPKLIRPDAFSIALNQVSQQKGINLRQMKPLNDERTGIGYDGKSYKGVQQQPQQKPTSPFEVAAQRILEKRQQEKNKLQQLYTR